MTKHEVLCVLARLALHGLPLVGWHSGVIVEASGDAFEDAVRFWREAGAMDAADLAKAFGAT